MMGRFLHSSYSSAGKMYGGQKGPVKRTSLLTGRRKMEESLFFPRTVVASLQPRKKGRENKVQTRTKKEMGKNRTEISFYFPPEKGDKEFFLVF